MSEDALGIILLIFLLTIFFLLGMLVGWSEGFNSTDQPTKNKIVCTQYLHGTWHSDVCLQNGMVISTK